MAGHRNGSLMAGHRNGSLIRAVAKARSCGPSQDRENGRAPTSEGWSRRRREAAKADGISG